jgi:2-oxoglutarate ferredoxin oxidoreductase subunit alpha
VQQARWGTHGDHPIIVLAPATTRDCFEVTVAAFNLSEKYRTPVIILSDEIVAHTREKIMLPPADEVEVVDRVKPTMPPEWYIPYEDTPRGVPPMAPFGEGYRYHVTGLVHDVRGFPTERPDEIEPFLNRLFRKINQHYFDINMMEEHLVEDAEVLVVAYGSVARSAKRAVNDARQRGLKAGLMKLITLWPFPWGNLLPRLRQVKRVLVPELNRGQIAREVKRLGRGLTRVETLNRIDGKLITPEQIVEGLVKI